MTYESVQNHEAIFEMQKKFNIYKLLQQFQELTLKKTMINYTLY